ncbi:MULTISPECIES: alkyl/aryl-sulfatase [Microbacterium]|uniref:Linear primary-alkylsulfatase n=1 Tax=Microbacterium trichothecenolyticum TaxID=69370 RepID=A0A0M2HIK6_MICTR|nr:MULTISPECIES: alkyl sulfatase dimerization domain-containing protein [Microbacterium]KJL44129.1 Metallo-beta-lactamase superfamily protein [Microbacterium trichothecenolyticum]MDR7189215.1 alkyl sulfatase BDS1-like metallo-beta-lactamase superfamily hydrolase [Microbacterium sp. BE35]
MQQREPEGSIREAHAKALVSLPFADADDFAAADRGFIGTLDDPKIRNADGDVVWDASSYDFVQGDAPASVHPSLWRQSKLVAKHGLFEVVPGLYQVRGLDLSVMSIIEGDTGVIVVDPLISVETAAAAMGLYREHRGERPIHAVIHSHSHIDHFGGVLGIVSQDDVDSGKVQIIVPEGFLEHSVAENVYAGTAMGRRAGYMYGAALDRGPRGQVGAGLGQTTSTGNPTILPPTLEVTATGETHTVDGVEFEFQMAPGTEAPSEMHFYLPRYRALCMAENATHTLHNLLTLRGALVRDPHMWSRYLTEALERYGDEVEVVFASHHWPTWGTDEIREFLGIQRDLYGYLHDQTLRLLNRGYNGVEIAEMIELPPTLEASWSTRGYYGSVSHNVKAIYQRYMGWFDGNPARLWPHPPQAQAERYVAAIGGVDRVVELAQEAFDSGDYRWAATLLDHAVFSDADHAAARTLYADTLEQLAYGSENGTWRNFFLSGATELREGTFGTPTQAAAPLIIAQLTPEQLLDAVAIRVDGPKAWDLDLALDVTLTDLGRTFHVTLRNGVLVYVEREADPETPLQLTLSKPRLIRLAGGDTDSEGIEVRGDAGVLRQILGVLDQGDPDFEIVLP